MLELIELVIDVSASIIRLQAERDAANQVLKEITPVETISDIRGLKLHLIDLQEAASVCV